MPERDQTPREQRACETYGECQYNRVARWQMTTEHPDGTGWRYAETGLHGTICEHDGICWQAPPPRERRELETSSRAYQGGAEHTQASTSAHRRRA